MTAEDVTDGSNGHISMAVVSISFRDPDTNDHPPQFAKSVYESSELDENEDIGHTVLTITAEDEDKAAELRYEITEGNIGGAFAVDKQTGAIAVNARLDYETRSQYDLTLVATDGLHESSTRVLIPLNDVNDNPPVFDKQVYVTEILEEDDTSLPKVILTVTAEDGDTDRPRGNLVYSLDGDVKDKFSVHAATGEVSVLRPLDRDPPRGQPRWRFSVLAQDEGGRGLVGYAEVEVRLRDVNDNAPFFPREVMVGYVAQNRPAGTEV